MDENENEIRTEDGFEAILSGSAEKMMEDDFEETTSSETTEENSAEIETEPNVETAEEAAAETVEEAVVEIAEETVETVEKATSETVEKTAEEMTENNIEEISNYPEEATEDTGDRKSTSETYHRVRNYSKDVADKVVAAQEAAKRAAFDSAPEVKKIEPPEQTKSPEEIFNES